MKYYNAKMREKTMKSATALRLRASNYDAQLITAEVKKCIIFLNNYKPEETRVPKPQFVDLPGRMPKIFE